MKAMSESQFQTCEVAKRSENPNGIPQQSPGLRGTSYPGLEDTIPLGLAATGPR